jgi:transglutaminase-like putative cysteine protease
MPRLTRAPLRLTALAALVSTIAAFGLVRMVASGPWIWLSLLLILTVAVAGHLSRCAPMARPLVVLTQLVAVGLLIVALRAHSDALAGFWPGPGALRELGQQFSAGGVDMGRESAPAYDTLGITTIMLCIVGPFAVLIDALAVTYRRAVLTGLPLLTVYLIPATRVGGGLSWFAFATISAGYLGLVSADGRDRLGRWGRTVEHPGARATTQGVNPFGSPHAAMARRIIGVAIVAALVVPWFVPTLPRVILGPGSGNGNGGAAGPGGGTLSLSQTVDLRASLTTTTAIPVLRYTTSSADPGGDYLRESVLNDFDGVKWSTGTGPPGDGQIRAGMEVPGLTDAGVAENPVTSNVTVVGDFAFGNLPAPYATLGVIGVPTATFDQDTLAIDTHQDATHSREGMKYTVSAIDVAPTSPQLNASRPVPADDPELSWYLQLPTDFPASVRTLAQQVTQGDTTPYSKALALEDYFQTKFIYNTSVAAGDGNDAITKFLTDKVGFCQQFAGTMAAMARALGIPAVVAIGFTAGAKQSDGTYLVTTHDAHAWPMLYFEGIGWLRFEPTPPSSPGHGQDPAYAQPGASATGPAKPAATATAATGPLASATGNGCGEALARLDPACRGAAGGAGGVTGVPFGSLGPLGAVIRWFHRWFLTGSAAVIAVKLLALALLLMAMLPAIGRLVRRRSRRSVVRQAQRYLDRAAASGPAARVPAQTRGGRTRRAGRGELTDVASAAWAELRESAEDLGYRWPDSDTPREAAARLHAAAAFDAPAAAAIRRVTALTEQVRYSPTAAASPETLRDLPADLRTVRGALAGHADRSARLRAAILPNSSINRLRERRDRTSARAYRLMGAARRGNPPAGSSGRDDDA